MNSWDRSELQEGGRGGEGIGIVRWFGFNTMDSFSSSVKISSHHPFSGAKENLLHGLSAPRSRLQLLG